MEDAEGVFRGPRNAGRVWVAGVEFLPGGLPYGSGYGGVVEEGGGGEGGGWGVGGGGVGGVV